MREMKLRHALKLLGGECVRGTTKSGIIAGYYDTLVLVAFKNSGSTAVYGDAMTHSVAA